MKDELEKLKIIILILIGANFISYLFIIHQNKIIINHNKILEVLITVNGIFSAILMTFLLGRLNISKETKRDAEKNAILLSQKLTDLRRIFHELTLYYNIWKSDDATKRLLDQNEFKTIDYYDYKLMSFSDYNPEDADLIKKLKQHKNYSDVETDLYLSMISIANNRKLADNFDSMLYDDYYDGETIYTSLFIERLLEINHLGRLSNNLKKYGSVIRYDNFDSSKKERLNSLLRKINPNYDLEKNHYINQLSIACSEIEDDILPKLLKSIYIIDGGLSKLELKIIVIIKISLLAGVIFPLINISIFEYGFKSTVSEVLILLNICMLFYFVFNIRSFSEEQI